LRQVTGNASNLPSIIRAMPRRKPPNWPRIMDRLRLRVAAEDVAAIAELGLTLFEGIQDRLGRSLVRRNAGYAVRLFKRAAKHGDVTAIDSLGYAYDVGLGVSRNKSEALRWYRRAVRLGSSTAAMNASTVYRDRGQLSRAHHWLMRAASMRDGDAAVDAGYDFLYGIGVRRDLRCARRMFNRALRIRDISTYGREEALYNLAIAYVDGGRPSLAVPLLTRACRDGDYPEAASLLAQIRANGPLSPCRCRRFLNKRLRGHAKCLQHPLRRPVH
jgi:TPR repeat protein